MKLKLNRSEMLALITCVSVMTAEMPNDDAEGKLSGIIAEEMLLAMKSKALVKKEKYSLTLKPSWMLVIMQYSAALATNATYEGVVIQRLFDDIHRSYC